MKPFLIKDIIIIIIIIIIRRRRRRNGHAHTHTHTHTHKQLLPFIRIIFNVKYHTGVVDKLENHCCFPLRRGVLQARFLHRKYILQFRSYYIDISLS